MPGAVLLIGQKARSCIAKRMASARWRPASEDMTIDTIFDLASLTKVVATTSSLMKLFEEGKFRLNDRVTQYFPEFQGGKSDITIRDLFTHFPGSLPDLPLNPPWTGYQTGIRMAMIAKPAALAGAHFAYSDINFILLGELVHRLSGQMLSDYAPNMFFCLWDAGNDVSSAGKAPAEHRPYRTEAPDGPPARHRSRSNRARHGGGRGRRGIILHRGQSGPLLQMLLRKGTLDGARVFSPLTVDKFTRRKVPAESKFCAAWVGTSIRDIRAIVANCFPKGLTGIPDLPAPPSGSIRSAIRM